MEPLLEPTNTVWSFPFPPQDWEQTPPAVQAYVRTLRDEVAQLHDRVETLQARLTQNSTTSSRPPSADSPYKKPRRHASSTTPRKAGGKPGHQGHRQGLLAPTRVVEVRPEPCVCGNPTFTGTSPYYMHQVIELPPIAMEVTHWILHQGWCQACGRWGQAHVPAEHASGYGPRFSALMGELAGTYDNGRRMVQTFCASVLQIPISLGAIQKVLHRVTQAIAPYYTVIAQQARQAPVNYIDETPWYCRNMLEWLWVMASERIAFYMIHPRRSKEAFAALIDDWEGILVSDGYGVYQHWVEARQTCLAHLIRTARGLAARPQAELAACGAWALVELQRLCHMATAPPTGGEWRAWYARLCKLIDQYHDRSDEAGRFARRLLREMDSLWVFLAQHGVEPTNNRAERALRFGVLWRKRSQGTASGKGNRWVERILSLKETCRLHARATYAVLVDAVTSFFHGQQPDLSWINEEVRSSPHPPVSACVCMREDSTMRLSAIGLMLTLALGILVAPLAAEAQPSTRVHRIGVLAGSTTREQDPFVEAFLEAMRALGYVEGQNLVLEYRGAAEHYERYPDLAAELVRLKVDVLMTGATAAALAAKHATTTIPIVLAGVGDPVGDGLVASLAHPGGNVTGLAALDPEVVGKQLEFLKEVRPTISQVAVLWNPTSAGHAHIVQEADMVAQQLGVQLHHVEARSPEAFDRAFAAMTRAHAGALLVLGDRMFHQHLKRLADLAAMSHLPAIYKTREFVEAGGLLCYGASLPDSWRRAATYVDKILKGTKPADLPVEQPTKFELVINLKTAQVLGITMPPSLLLLADEVLQ